MSDQTGDFVPIELLLAESLREAFPDAVDADVREMAVAFAAAADRAVAGDNVNRQEAARMALRLLNTLGGGDTPTRSTSGLPAPGSGPYSGFTYPGLGTGQAETPPALALDY